LFVFVAGFIIPKGWRIYVYTREVNYDPRLYPDPYSFKPWRWLVSSVVWKAQSLMKPVKIMPQIHLTCSFVVVNAG